MDANAVCNVCLNYNNKAFLISAVSIYNTNLDFMTNCNSYFSFLFKKMLGIYHVLESYSV